ncbi:MAG TPA: carboxypeptidase-like regulatory domain-containing protein [Methanomassiliicoccales archaeon]|nr:carboxypeptidase-like regulatory domain-containing protein [Methanomassiliicoccales archaeon]
MHRSSVALLALALVLCTCVPGGTEAAGVGGTDIVGRVVDETGAAFPGVEVRAVNAASRTIYSAYSGPDGNYTMPSNFVQGRYDVSAHFTNHSANITYYDVQVGLGQVLRLNFTMREVLCALTGFVTNGTTPVYGATVTLVGTERNYSGVSSQPFGQYNISGVRPGTYTVVASKVGYYPSDPMPPVDMVRGDTKRIDFVLREQPAELTGMVRYDGNGLSGVKVRLSNAQFTAETITDAEGNYTFAQVPSGSYTITFSKDQFLTVEMSVGLSPFEAMELNIEMEYDSANNTQTFLLGLDLAHSLMVVGLGVSLIILAVGLYIDHKVRRRPDVLEREDEGAEKGSEKG